MMLGSWSMATAAPINSLEDVVSTLRAENAVKLVAVTGMGIACVAIRTLALPPLALPSFIVLVYGLFWVAVVSAEASIDRLQRDAWLFSASGDFSEQSMGALWTSLRPSLYRWSVLQDVVWPMAGLALISTFDMSLNLPALQARACSEKRSDGLTASTRRTPLTPRWTSAASCA